MAPPPPGTGPATEKAHQGGASLTVQMAPEAGCPRGHPGLGRWPGKRGVSLVPGQVQAGPASLTAQGLPGVPGGLTPLCYLHAPGSGGPRSPPAATSALGFSVNGGRRLLPELQNLKALGFLGAALHQTPCQAQPPLGQPHFLLLEPMPAPTFPGSSEPRPNHDLWASHLSHLPAAHCPQSCCDTLGSCEQALGCQSGGRVDPRRPDGLEPCRGPAASRNGAHLPLPHTPASPPGWTGRGKREPALVHGPTSACSQAVHPLGKLPGVALTGGPHGPDAAWRCYVPPPHPRELGTRLQGPPHRTEPRAPAEQSSRPQKERVLLGKSRGAWPTVSPRHRTAVTA